MIKYKFIALIIIMSLILSLLIVMAGCSVEDNKAILVLPGVMGSIYYTIDEDTGEKIAIWSGEASKEITSSFLNMYMLECDDEGQPLYDNVHVATWEDKELWRYGANLKIMPGFGQERNQGDVIRGITQEINEEYGDVYDVRVWQYDWRLDLRDLGQQLEEFINNQGYTEVILVTHSMGGVVASNYLARSQANRDRVSLFVPIAAPFLGSVEIYSYMESGAFPGYDDIGLDISSLTGFGNTIQSAYQLFPSRQLFDGYPDGISPITVNNEPLNYDQAQVVLKNRPWAQKRQSEGIRPQFNFIEESVNALFDEDGNHVSTKVNSYYIGGNGYNTRYNINYTTEDINGIYDNMNDRNTNNLTVSGDSIVPLYSAVLGFVDNDGNPTRDNIMIISTSTSSHMYLAANAEVKAKVIELIGNLN